MKEHPILFSAEMVRAIPDGNRTGRIAVVNGTAIIVSAKSADIVRIIPTGNRTGRITVADNAEIDSAQTAEPL